MMKRFSDPGGVSVGGGGAVRRGTFQVGGLAMSAGERERVRQRSGGHRSKNIQSWEAQ